MSAARDKSPSKANGSGAVDAAESKDDAIPAPLLSEDKPETASTVASNELTTAVDDLLNELRTKFQTVSDEMFSKMDDMSRRLDNLENQLRRRDSLPKGDAETTSANNSR